jgi:8-oxo-dGTP pyrophosphatase MutT (NUDIX family)
MYKVFFNGSAIEFTSETKKSSKNNIGRQVEIGSYIAINQIVSEVESSKGSTCFLLRHQEVDRLWNHFRRRFIEIPAAGGLVRNQQGAFLFIRRLGVWDLPKGKIEADETTERAAIREVEEECGLAGLKIVRQLDSTFHIYRSPYLNYPDNLVLKETNWFLMDYSGDETPTPETEEDIDEVCWVPVSELETVLADTYASLREFLEKTLKTI